MVHVATAIEPLLAQKMLERNVGQEGKSAEHTVPEMVTAACCNRSPASGKPVSISAGKLELHGEEEFS